MARSVSLSWGAREVGSPCEWRGENGWNAIYLESTPTNALCDAFFEGAPVKSVASYQSDAYSSTRQLADDGTEIAQKPLSYRVWVPGDDVASTMSALSGGHVYMIYATNAWSKTFVGVPSAPKQKAACNARETGSIPGLGRSSGGRHGNPFQYSCLKNPMVYSPDSREELDTPKHTAHQHSLPRLIF